jgi:glycosyltransferase involved in cell wall biosynthesis
VGSVDFIVPTLMRPDHLTRCLDSLVTQTAPITRIFVGIRSDDSASREVIADFAKRGPVIGVTAEGVGVIGSMNSCLRQATSDIVGLVDDDVELPTDWLARIASHLQGDKEAVAAGGRDLLMDYPEMRRSEPLTEDVGRFCWFGRTIGNHHLGGGKARRVDILRGSNVLFRGDFLRECRFDSQLAGRGAQVHWELALALQAKQRGYHMIFDPQVQVLHHVAPRLDNDTLHRGQFDAAATRDVAYNESSISLRHGRGLHRWMMLSWQLLIGSAICPGAVRLIPRLIREGAMALRRYVATTRGRLDAMVHFMGHRSTH